jgi:hypothetical protein
MDQFRHFLGFPDSTDGMSRPAVFYKFLIPVCIHAAGTVQVGQNHPGINSVNSDPPISHF